MLRHLFRGVLRPSVSPLRLARPLSDSSSIDSNADTTASFPGARTHFSYTLEFRDSTPELPCFRVMDEKAVVHSEADPELPEETLVRMYETMIRLHVMDDVMLNVQRQGRSSFYMQHTGEEGLLVGGAAALDDRDMVFGQYREAGVLLWRGFDYTHCMNQCLSNDLDTGKGRQMPIHYGSKDHHFQTISSPLGTQIPHAVGLAYAQRHLIGESDRCSVVYFGDGASSEGDFHAGINFATTLDVPTIFFCRNNGYAISTPAKEQFRGDGVGGRGPAFAIDTVRVDGNDVLAVYAAVKAAREFAVTNSRPVMIEAMSYRIGSHSTSDDASRYRNEAEVSHWKTHNSPINRLRLYLEDKGWWDDDAEDAIRANARSEILEALSTAERRKKPALHELFTDVYDEIPTVLAEQQESLKKHLEKHGDKYGLDTFASKDL